MHKSDTYTLNVGTRVQPVKHFEESAAQLQQDAIDRTRVLLYDPSTVTRVPPTPAGIVRRTMRALEDSGLQICVVDDPGIFSEDLAGLGEAARSLGGVVVLENERDLLLVTLGNCEAWDMQADLAKMKPAWFWIANPEPLVSRSVSIVDSVTNRIIGHKRVEHSNRDVFALNYLSLSFFVQLPCPRCKLDMDKCCCLTPMQREAVKEEERKWMEAVSAYVQENTEITVIPHSGEMQHTMTKLLNGNSGGKR